MTKPIGILSVLLTAFVLVNAGSSCSPLLSEEGGPCPCKDGWKCCGNTCIQEQYSCIGDGGIVACDGNVCHPDMVVPRFGHASVLLEDGRILITGGISRNEQGTETIQSTAEVFDPVTGEFEMVEGPDGIPLKMLASTGRAYHTATLLLDGTVMVAGGFGHVEGKKSTLQTAEIFDPTDSMFKKASVMGTDRAHHAATILDNGDVLITGGASYSNGVLDSYYDTGLRYDPKTNSFNQIAGTMRTARAFHQAVLLDPLTSGGKVLITGGEEEDGPMNSAEVFDPETMEFFDAEELTMAKPRSHHCSVRLENGEVLVVGGKTGNDDSSTDAEAEIYSTAEGNYGGFKEQIFNLQSARMGHSCTLLETGNVLVTGGFTNTGVATYAGELIIVSQDTYSVQQVSESLAPARAMHTATMLGNGWILLAGGLPDTEPVRQPVGESLFFTTK